MGWAQKRFELVKRPSAEHTNGVHRPVYLAGDLHVGQSVSVSPKDRLPVPARKSFEGIIHPLVILLSNRVTFWRALVADGKLANEVLGVVGRERKLHVDASLLGANIATPSILDVVEQDSSEPVKEFRGIGRLEPVEVPMRLNQGLLNQIRWGLLSLESRSDFVIRNSKEERTIGFKKRIDRSHLTGYCLGQQPRQIV
jgi:hypothetical protein